MRLMESNTSRSLPGRTSSRSRCGTEYGSRGSGIARLRSRRNHGELRRGRAVAASRRRRGTRDSRARLGKLSGSIMQLNDTTVGLERPHFQAVFARRSLFILVALLLAETTINFIDRQVVSVLAP